MSLHDPSKNYVFLSTIETWTAAGLDVPEHFTKVRGSMDKCIDFMNLCLWLHDNITKQIKGNPEQQALYDDILDSGSGFGIDDMREALEALETAIKFKTKNGGPFELDTFRKTWSDEDMADYSPSKYSLWPKKRGSVHAPEAFVNYMEALSEVVGDMVEAIDEAAPNLKRMTISIEEQRWDDLKSASKKVSTLAKAGKYVTWFAHESWDFENSISLKLKQPAPLDSIRRQQVISAYEQLDDISQANRILDKVGTYTGLINKVAALTKSAELMIDLQTKGELDEVTAGCLAGIHFAAGYIPILGSVYQDSIIWFAGFLPEWRSLMEDRKRISEDVVGFLEEKERERERLRNEQQ